MTRPGVRSVLERLEKVLWQLYAHAYDGLLGVFTYRDMLDRVAVLAGGADLRVLDVGAGTGNVTRALLQSGVSHVISVDASGNMLARARRKLAADVDRGRVEIIHGDAIGAMAALPDAAIDRIVAVNVLYALPSRVEFFAQAQRILVPGGFIIASHTTRPGAGPIVRDQVRRGGLGAILRPRLIAIAAIDLVIDLVARSGRYDFAPIQVLADEAAGQGLTAAVPLGRCYGGDTDGVNELVRIAA